jgi:ABC-type lipoprotein release transport system permease subunit
VVNAFRHVQLRDFQTLLADPFSAQDGMVGALALTHLMASLLFGVSAFDPLTLTAVPALLASVAMLASYLAARRALSVEPMTALREG